MTMKHIMAMVFLALLTSAVADADGVPASGNCGENAGVINMRQPRRRLARPSGGILLKKIDGPVIMVRNKQSVFSKAEVEAAVRKAMFDLYLPIVIVGSNETRADVAAEIVLVDRPSQKRFTLVTAPEQCFAELSTDWLVSDSPSAERRAERLAVELLRAVASSLGCGASMYQPDIMCHVQSVLDVDRISKDQLGPGSRNVIDASAKRLGLNKITVASYRRACQQGWAPPPTNDVQRAIWNEVHTIPTTPMKIEFDPKKGR